MERPQTIRCPQCDSAIASNASFCSHCGVRLTPSADAETIPNAPAHRSSNLASEKPFAPGTLIAHRYRIVSLLGRGGMGEVFLAEDLTLHQLVALKQLPESLIDSAMLERFHNEVRIARRISHPNVCRVHDIGQSGNHVFLSMEYVQGEDLASRLRRTGRLPRTQAIRIARELCSGLAAAHEQGVLHRDLKPSNIMLDEQGKALIMDFGLASLAHEIEDVRSGTPAYMAPEQLAGREVTVRSDIYSLGLVLFELFTGKPAFAGTTYEEILRARRESLPPRPSTVMPDLDPTVEMAIVRCLEVEPQKRPSSALIVSPVLPGGEYLIAIYRPDSYDPSTESEAMNRDIDVLNDEMVAAGARVLVAGFSSAASARSLRFQPDGNLTVTEGPYSNASEHVVGFWVVKAANLDEALAWARKAAFACRASVEVRPYAYPQ